MRLNQELRTPNMVVRFHLLWLLFYVMLFSGLVLLGLKMYEEHDEDQFPSGGIELRTSKERYKPGEQVTFEIENHFPTTIYVTNNCPQEPMYIYKWQNEKWVQIHDTATSKDSDCYKQPRRIAIKPNSILEYHFDDWPDLFKKAGVYRIVTDIDHYENLPFTDFVVLKKPKTIIKKVTPPQPQPAPSYPQSNNNYRYDDDEEDEDEHEDEEDEDEDEDDD